VLSRFLRSPTLPKDRAVMLAGAAAVISTVAAANMRIEAVAGIEVAGIEVAGIEAAGMAAMAEALMAGATAAAISASVVLCNSFWVFVAPMATEARSSASSS
jgi:hypothetical protein